MIDRGGRPNPNLPPGVGETPLVEIEGILVKLECLNPCGSVKDRIAAYILTRSRELGLLQPGQPIVEATSGNTGIAFAYYGRQLGHPVTIVMPEHMTDERKDLIRKLGAELILCSKEGSFAEAAEIRDRLAQETGAFNPDQFSNELNAECHERTTGDEIVRQTADAGIEVRNPAFVAGVGTGGTLIGVGTRLRQAWGAVEIAAVEPTEAAVMTGGDNQPHGIFGIGDGFIPAIASDGNGGTHPLIGRVEVVSTAAAMEAAQDLSDRHRLCVGVSSGANFVAAKRLRQEFDTVVTVFADGHHKYHSAGIVAPGVALCPFHQHCSESVLETLLAGVETE